MKYSLLVGLVWLVGCTQTSPVPLYVEDRVFVWGEIQTTPDLPVEQWDWSAADAVLAKYDQPISLAIWPYALWDQASCHALWSTVITTYGIHFQAPYPVCDETAYQYWLTQIEERYGDQVADWRVIDDHQQQEPPLANFIGSEEDYSRLVDLTKTVIMDTL
ncbi:MAG: hypothetical protein ACD_41C00097G0001 [uncultured bacterium]|nr:MAG: hypothetical protein ACD_41C00097G0001 [uncultured bacterium]HBY74181.1 hypothetical protein [Candidatus Kerfeldbacteria bacterium]